MRRTRLFAPLSLMAFAGACAAPPVDIAAESAKLLTRDAEWSALASAGANADTVASYWTTDAVLYPTAQPPVVGRAALRAYVDGMFKTPGFKIHWVSNNPVFSPDGKMAYLHGITTINAAGANGKPVTLREHGITVWRLDADGQWRCAVDIGTEAPAASPTGAAK